MLRNPVYVGKIRWREVQYDGHHDPVVSEILFEKAQEVLKARHEELKGRQFHTGDERLLTGIIKCAKCKSHMFGASGTKNGVLRPYYVCSKRFNYHECNQHNVAGDLLEKAIIEDVKGIFQIGNFFFPLRGQEGHVPFTVVFCRARNISVADSRNQLAAR
jgi:site-specific DNA recombinase